MITNFRNNISWNRISNSKFRRQLFLESFNLVKVSNHSWSLSCNSFCTFPYPNKTVMIRSSFSDISLSNSLKTCFIYYLKYLSTQSDFNLNRTTFIKFWEVIKRGFYPSMLDLLSIVNKYKIAFFPFINHNKRPLLMKQSKRFPPLLISQLYELPSSHHWLPQTFEHYLLELDE
mgnify:CR=1 FL=1